MPKITIDDTPIEARDGQTILQAALEHGIHIPHLCYHPRLETAGNCRMCLVEIEKVPKLQIACATPVQDGMVVHTRNERVTKARKGVLEFLLINHPLDCPICDQCGECKLQDYCFEYGQETSRFREAKERQEPQDIGPDLVHDLDRCIHCTRCIRFLRDVAGSEEFALCERGHHATVGPYVEHALESPFSMNLAEVCPVGALTSRHFRFQARSWLMDKTRTLCAGCSRGCNVIAWSYKGELKRLTPAENDAVNLSWMCNPGRLSVGRVHDDDRIREAHHLGKAVPRTEALEEAAKRLGAIIERDEGGRVGLVASARLTNEDNYLVRKLAREVFGTAHLAFVAGPDDPRPFGPLDEPLPAWFIREDKFPNTRGARDVVTSTGHDQDVDAMIDAIQTGGVRAMLVFSCDLGAALDASERVQAALKKLDYLLVVDTHWNQTARLAQTVLPEASFAEKNGTYTNEAGRVQRLQAAIPFVGASRPAWFNVQELARLLGASWYFKSAGEVTAELAAKLDGYQDVSLEGLAPEGWAPPPADGEESRPEGAAGEQADNAEASDA